MPPLKRPVAMLDLETMGKRPGCAIVAIGAVAFDLLGTEVDTERHGFYVNVDLADCVRHGLELDPSTIMWWLGQSDEARKALTRGEKASLPDALDRFRDWKSRYGDIPIMGNGAAFDQPILEAAYHAIGQSAPWSYTKAECFRTLKNLTAGHVPAPERQGTHHNALDDAAHQARHMQAIVRRLYIGADRNDTAV